MYTTDDDSEQSGQGLRSNMFSLSGTGFFGAVGRSIDLGTWKNKYLMCLSLCLREKEGEEYAYQIDNYFIRQGVKLL